MQNEKNQREIKFRSILITIVSLLVLGAAIFIYYKYI